MQAHATCMQPRIDDDVWLLEEDVLVIVITSDLPVIVECGLLSGM